jgi:succinate dehydrogenase / fumarate reductase cytochrome b subunit
MARPARPLSPHLQIYRWQWTMLLSILHRITGVGLGLGAILLVYWLTAAASGPASFAAAQDFIGSWFGILLLFGFSLALFYHLCNGIRHLFWDAGLGFELDTAYTTALVVGVAAVALTALAWIIGLAG